MSSQDRLLSNNLVFAYLCRVVDDNHGLKMKQGQKKHAASLS